MTGIGKTTLVEKVYSDPSVVEEFETRLFVHIGPRYNRSEEIMWLVLYQLGITSDRFLKRDYVKQLSETLSDKKYLIVLEDVWAGLHAWHDLEYGGFPVNGKGSRVIIISQIDRYVVSSVVVLPLLKDNESWKLLRQTAFSGSEDKCSHELEKIGKTIAKNCKGLPAAIIQVGVNLRGKSFQEWKTLSEKEDPLVITKDDDTPLSEALYFSYMMLSQRLKLCFLYMGVFPKNYVISRSKLIKLWVCESFVPDLSRLFSTPEEIAGGNIDQLIHQSVVLKEKSTALNLYNAKKCRLHFTFRSLCVNEAKSEKFFHILKKYSDCKPHNIRSHKRLCAHNNVVLAFAQVQEWMESVLDVRSLLCLGPNQQYPIVLPLHFRLLKVLDALAIRFYEFPHQILGLLHLTYLSITCDRELPSSISRLWNLEVLIFRRHHKIKLSINGPVYLPIDIWNMHRLTQLYCKGFDLPAPPLDDSHLENLKTLSGVSVHSCTREVLSRIPKLTRLAVHIESAHGATENFSFFDHISTLHEGLESFKCVVVNPNLSSQVVPCFQSFPKYVRKMILSGCRFKWKNMGAIAAFEGLQVLKLRWYAVSGPVWKTNAKQFPSLMFLLLEDLDIEHWESDGERFPYLGHVIFSHCYKLKSIPDQLKHVKRIEVDDCSRSLEKQMCEW
ncbi:hypothetical protein ABFS83_01G095000 [Erythranthe nasuta]